MSGILRRTKMFGRSIPGISGRIGSDPTARISVSYDCEYQSSISLDLFEGKANYQATQRETAMRREGGKSHAALSLILSSN